MSLDHDNQVGADAAGAQFPELLARVQAGEVITITRQGTPVARLVPTASPPSPEERRATIARWKELSKGLSLGGLKIRDLINEGRR